MKTDTGMDVVCCCCIQLKSKSDGKYSTNFSQEIISKYCVDNQMTRLANVEITSSSYLKQFFVQLAEETHLTKLQMISAISTFEFFPPKNDY